MRKVSPIGYRETVKCDGCGKEFIKMPYLVRPTNYCSLPCYHSSTKIRSEKQCLICKKTFTPSPTQVRHGFGIYCSRKCQNKVNRDNLISKVCQQCGKTVKRSPAVAIHTIFCSKKCHDLAMSDFETHSCAQCAKEFQIPTWETKKGKGKFCSRECFIKFNGESSLEEKVRKYLESKHVQFQQEVKFGRYRADFLLTGTKTIIECDGEFWHLRPQTKIRDKRKDEYLHNLGYQVFRLTGRQINEHFSESMNSLPLMN